MSPNICLSVGHQTVPQSVARLFRKRTFTTAHRHTHTHTRSGGLSQHFGLCVCVCVRRPRRFITVSAASQNLLCRWRPETASLGLAERGSRFVNGALTVGEGREEDTAEVCWQKEREKKLHFKWLHTEALIGRKRGKLSGLEPGAGVAPLCIFPRL